MKRTGARPAAASVGAVVVLALLLGGCGGSGDGPEPARRSDSGVVGAPEDSPRRIVTLAPNLTEIAFELGLGDRVVGVSDFTRWPPEAEERPRLGGLFDPNLERMVALEPDLAILLPSQDEVARNLAGLGIPTLTIGIETVAELDRAVLAIAERCGVAEAGRRLAARLRRELAPRPVPGAPPAVVVVDRTPGRSQELLVAGPRTYFQELLERLGSENVFADAPLRYPTVGMEEVLTRAPRVIVEIRLEEEPEPVRERLLADWRRYPSLPAVANGDLYLIAGDWALVLGPRLPRLYAELEAVLRSAADSLAPAAPADPAAPVAGVEPETGAP